MGDGRGRRKTSENSGKQRKTAGDHRGRRGMVGDGGGRHNVVRPGPGLLLVGQVLEKSGRDDEMSSVLVLPRCEHWISKQVSEEYTAVSSFYTLSFSLLLASLLQSAPHNNIHNIWSNIMELLLIWISGFQFVVGLGGEAQQQEPTRPTIQLHYPQQPE